MFRKLYKIAVLTLIFGGLSLTTFAQGDGSTDATSEETENKKEKKEKKPIDPRAQKPYRTWSLTLVPGFTNPLTDIRYNDFFGTTKPKNEYQFGGSAHVLKMFSGAFGVQGSFFYGKLVGVVDDNVKSKEQLQYLQQAGITQPVYFETSVYQGSVALYFNISNAILGINRHYKAKQKEDKMGERRFSVYSYVGVGLSFYDAQVNDLGTETPLPPNYLQTTSGSANDIVIPLGIGAKFKLGKCVDLGIEQSYHFLMSDKLDGFVYDFPTRTRNDKFSHTGISLGFKFGTKKKDKEHYEWINPLESVLDDFDEMERKVDKLSMDTDKDGVADMFDKESNTPSGVKVDGSGVAMDVDYDGVPDHEDVELFSDKGATVDASGIAADGDGDGVPDTRDREPNTPAGALVNFEGVSIADNLEIEIPASALAGRGGGLHSIYFNFNSTTISRDQDEDLFEVAMVLKNNPGMKMRVIGHTDSRGSEQYNQDLGERRAQAVADYLTKNYGVPAESLIVESMGKSSLDSHRDEINRRVDFKIKD